MDEKQEKKTFAGEKVPSMKRRSCEHDGTEDAPRVELSPLGLAVCREWSGISGYYPQVAVIAQQVMPDHFHGILYFREKTALHLGHVIRGFKAGCNRAYRQLAATESQQTREGAALVGRSFPRVLRLRRDYFLVSVASSTRTSLPAE